MRKFNAFLCLFNALLDWFNFKYEYSFSHQRGRVNWALLSYIEIVSSTYKCHFLVINLASEVLQDEDISKQT